jgi:hypothetical protein
MDVLDRADPAIEALQEELISDLPPRQRDVLVKGLLGAMGKLSRGLSSSEI